MTPNGIAATTWRKSGRCESQHCVEVARFGAGVAIRDSKDPERHVLVDAASWRAFVGTLRVDTLGSGD